MKNKLINIALASLLSLCAIGLITQYYKKIAINKMKANIRQSNLKMIVPSKINSVSTMMKTNQKWLNYSFTYNGKNYNKEVSDNFNFHCNRIDYENHFVPVVILKNDPDKSSILFHPRDFVYFGYNPPDSMKWLFDCIEPSGSYIFSPAPISPDIKK